MLLRACWVIVPQMKTELCDVNLLLTYLPHAVVHVLDFHAACISHILLRECLDAT